MALHGLFCADVLWPLDLFPSLTLPTHTHPGELRPGADPELVSSGGRAHVERPSPPSTHSSPSPSLSFPLLLVCEMIYCVEWDVNLYYTIP